MELIDKAVRIITSFDEFTDVKPLDDGKVSFQYRGKHYYIDNLSDSETAYPCLFVLEYDSDIPHIMSEPFDDGYRYVCIREEGKFIGFLDSFDEKIRNVCIGLIELMNLSPAERESEFHKEFMYYWNEACNRTYPCELYLGSDDSEACLMNTYGRNLQDGGYSRGRLIKYGVPLNDRKKSEDTEQDWKHLSGISGVYIPLITAEGILPPIKGHPWNRDFLQRILDKEHVKFISERTFEKLSEYRTKGSILMVVIGIPFEESREYCLIKITTVNMNKVGLFERLGQSLSNIRVMRSVRCDYRYLSGVIGNDLHTEDKDILIVGAGSLGSYVCREMVNAGYNRLTIFDKDLLEPENSFRWGATDSNLYSMHKVDILKFELERINPEIFIDANRENLTANTLKKIYDRYDAIVFTVGSSDFQYEANKLLKEKNYQGRAIFVWLEAGGNYSHILCVNYSNPGCYQCLFTDSEGNITANQYNREKDDTLCSMVIRNACGGTRAAYGNAILLRTTAVLLDYMKRIFEKGLEENWLIDITPNEVINHRDEFRNKQCGCCGNRCKTCSYKTKAP